MPAEPWMEKAFELVSLRAKDPPAASRAYALLAVAMHDAVVAASHWQEVHRREARTNGADAPPRPSKHTAIAGAASRLLAYLFPERPRAEFEQMAAAATSRVVPGTSTRGDAQSGLALGRAVAAKVIARARTDGAGRRWDGKRPRGPGYWEPPPGSVARPVSPMAGTWRTWVLRSGSDLRPPPPPAFRSAAFRGEAEEVVRVSRQLTPDQKRIAKFWEGGEGTALPPGIWNRVVLAYLRHARLGIARSTRALALLNVGMSDAGVAAWDAKYAYWNPRPENAIRDLGLDRRWKPYLETPFFPAYVSGHATYSGAAGEVLAHLFPEDADLFRAKAREAAMSRVYGGIHYPMDGEVGIRMGRRIGELVVERARRDGVEERSDR
ncbi:MAG: phosphatase PAP2 family protein [Actinomycetota bacterium]|nr:phosphatase PAP2 family protein [Actinomycetota bacterium]